jgi:tRNA pseudouridine38-40 synthase
LSRYFLQIAYKGTHYHGWQVQQNATGIQEIFNEKLSVLFGEAIYCIGCGRTDTGVHARKFFLHFDTTKPYYPGLAGKLNIFLPKDIVVQKVFEAPGEAHARWNATSRTYEYILSMKKDPFLLGLAGFEHNKLDTEKMNAACELLIQYHDFEALSKVNVQNKHHLCNIFEARWQTNGDVLLFTISANRFLRGMVRVVVGTMILIGKGKMSLDEFKTLLESKDRRKAGPAALADGLYLTDVQYPEGLLKEIL